MSRLFILTLFLCWRAMAFAQSGMPDSSFIAGIERTAITDSTNPRVSLQVYLECSEEIAAAEFTIVYNPDNLHLLDITPGNRTASFSTFETVTDVPGKIDILTADFTGNTIPAAGVENLFSISFGLLPEAGPGEHAVLFTKAILADPEANRYIPVVVNGAVINPFAGVEDKDYRYYGSDYAFWVNAKNDSPISFYLKNRQPVAAMELRIVFNPEVSEFTGFYEEPRIQEMGTQEAYESKEGTVSLVIADYSGNTIAPGSEKLFTLTFSGTDNPAAFFFLENFVIADSAANRITPTVFYQETYSPFETTAPDTTSNLPKMVLSATEISFGEVQLNESLVKKLIIMNIGDADLVVSDISSDNTVFTPDITSATILPATDLDIQVSFIPQTGQSYTGALTISSNAGMEQVMLSGSGINLPSEPGGCDFNGDGRINITDVIVLLLYQRENPGDLIGDYNGDGSSTITDAVAMLQAQLGGTCTDSL
ncbi:cohesin domain-containing protein [Gemmatimonadota bacterium]